MFSIYLSSVVMGKSLLFKFVKMQMLKFAIKAHLTSLHPLSQQDLWLGAYSFDCLFVCLFITNFNIVYYFWTSIETSY